MDDLFELGRKSGIEANGRNGRAIENGIVDGGGGVALKRKLAGGHFVEDSAEGEEIGAGVEIPGARLFGRHVGDGADGAAGVSELMRIGADGGERVRVGMRGGRRFRGGDFGEAEIENFGVAAAGDEDVGGFDVAMDDLLGVGGVEAVGDIDGEGKEEFEVHGTPADSVFQGLAVEKFHGDEGFAIVFADVVNGADVGMIERGRGFGFATEAFEGLGIVGDVVGKEFQGNEAVEARVFGFINYAHSAATEFFENAVVGDGPTEKRGGLRHVGRILGMRRGEVKRGGEEEKRSQHPPT